MHNKFLGTGEHGYHPIRKIQVCLAGLRFALRHDFSFSYKFFLSVLILLISFYFRQWLDFLLILLSTGLVLVAEMFNTALEALCDFIETEENDKIQVIKDISAAATGISILVWSLIMLIEIARLWLVFTAT